MVSQVEMKIRPLDGFRLVEGYSGITVSLKRISEFYGYEIDEETLLGLGGGLGFVHWQKKGALPHMNSFGRISDFFPRLSVYTGACFSEHSTTSQSKAFSAMVDLLNSGNPVMVFGDVAELPYWRDEFLALQDGRVPLNACHFGHHAFIVAGIDAAQTQALLADFVFTKIGRKSGRYEVVSLRELAAARDSRCLNTPPMNRWFTFSFSKAHQPTSGDYYDAIRQTVLDMLRPAIQNFGIPGMRNMAHDLLSWPDLLTVEDLKQVLYSIYLQAEIIGAGGGNIREVYARFLEKARLVTGNPWLDQSARLFRFAAEQWHMLVEPLSAVYSLSDPVVLLPGLREDLLKVSYTEETALKLLGSAIPR